MLSLIWRSIKDRKTSLIAYSLGAVVFLEMYIAMFPLFADRFDQEQIDKLLQAYPEQIFQALGMDPADFTLAKFESFVATEYFSLIWPIMAIIFVIAYGGAQIAGEIEKGTIETVLAQPLSRLKIFFGKYLSGVAALGAFTISSIFMVVPLAKLHGVEYKLENFATAAILGFLFALAIFSLSMFSTALFSEKGKSNFTVGGVVILMYVLNVISTFKESLKDLRYLSFFHYYDYSAALLDNKLDSLAIWVFLGVSVVATIAGALWFMHRDVAV